MNNEELVLKISSPFISHDLDYYDPLKIKAMNQMLISDALYSKILDFNQNGEIVPSLASSFNIKGNNEVLFTIRNDLITIDGKKITAKDVAFSLKRLVIYSNAFSHHIHELIDGCEDIKSPLDNCSGIKVEDNNVIIKSKIQPDLLIESLTSSSYAIVPISSCETGNDLFNINDFRNTSGAYYFEKVDDDGYLVLKANPNHFHYDPKMPHELVFIGTTDRKEVFKFNVLEQFKNGVVELLPTSGHLSIIQATELLKDDSWYNFHFTHDIKVSTAKFTLLGRHLSVSDRLIIANKVIEFYKKYTNKMKVHPIFKNFSYQYIRQPGFGSLNDEQVGEFRMLLNEKKEMDFKAIKVQIFSYFNEDFINGIKEEFPDVIFVESNEYRISSTDRVYTPDAHIVFTNESPGMNESYSNISWALKASVFSISQKESRGWLNNYVRTNDWKERSRMFQKLHYHSLAVDPSIIPLTNFPFMSFIKKPWKQYFSKFDSRTPIHMIRYE